MEDGEWELPNPKVQEQERQAWTQEQKPWKPKNLKIDPERQARLKEKMENSMKKLESSKFYTSFIEQLKSPEVSDHFRLALGNETQFKMVIYGIGKIESHDEYEYPRLQLSMAILMRKEFDWIGDNMEVFDPVLSATEINILESLGCTVLYVNEQCHREALKPTIFFMPYCFRTLYGNLLQANWKVDLLSRMVLFGNSFKRYVDYPYLFSDINGKRATERITAARRFTREFAIKTQARKAAEKAREVVKVEERVNRAVMVANRAANAARVAATKAVQTQTFQSSSGDDPL